MEGKRTPLRWRLRKLGREELIRAIEPDVIVKGGDYTEAMVVGAAEVRARGGSVVIVPLTPGQSTTSIVEKLRESR